MARIMATYVAHGRNGCIRCVGLTNGVFLLGRHARMLTYMDQAKEFDDWPTHALQRGFAKQSQPIKLAYHRTARCP